MISIMFRVQNPASPHIINSVEADMTDREGACRRTRAVLYGWLSLSVGSLVFAGVFAVIIALARTPVVEGLFPGGDYVRRALVGHVVLSVVVWLLSFEGFLWVYTSTGRGRRPMWSPGAGYAALASAGAGVALLAVSTVAGLGEPVFANYVPVLKTPVFYVGLALFSAAAALTAANAFTTVLKAPGPVPAEATGMLTAGAAVASAAVCVAAAARVQMSGGAAVVDFDHLFWGGGHMLQFANTAAMVVAWLCLVRFVTEGPEYGDGSPPAPATGVGRLFAPYLAFIVPAPLVYLIDGGAAGQGGWFTWLMAWGLGPATFAFIAVAIWSCSGSRAGLPGWLRDPVRSSLALSVAAFTIGVALGVLVDGPDTRVPAHYHSAIGAVTIAFMGLFYRVLPAAGRVLYGPRIASVQPWLYACGVVVFSLGLYWAGVLGVGRKAYSGEQGLDTAAKTISMAVMAAGGLLAVSGGVLFVALAMASLFHPAFKVRR